MNASPPDRQPDRAIRVAIVEDDRATREGLDALISGAEGYDCVATFCSVEDALEGMSAVASNKSSPVSPDVLLLDIRLPGMSGSDGVRLFQEKFPKLEIVIRKRSSNPSATALAATC
jgi:DNA-binding NarL/FixJ family response regulator